MTDWKGRTFGQLSKVEQDAALREAVSKLQAEFDNPQVRAGLEKVVRDFERGEGQVEGQAQIPIATNMGSGAYVVEHSDFGFRPGVWPSRVTVRVNGLCREFQKARMFMHGEEFGGFEYDSVSKLLPERLTVFND